jgi:hypothetical protein
MADHRASRSAATHIHEPVSVDVIMRHVVGAGAGLRFAIISSDRGAALIVTVLGAAC